MAPHVFNLIPHSFIVEVETAIRGDVENTGSSFEVPLGKEKQLEGSKISY